jgi:hypothetical protein
LTATGTDRAEAERLCRDAVHGIRLALREVELGDRALVHVLLGHETERAVDRVFGPAAHGADCRRGAHGEHGATGEHPQDAPPRQVPPGYPGGPYPGQDPNQAPIPPWVPQGPGFTPPGGKPPHPRNLLAGCAVWALMACTCQLLCCEHNDPFSRERRKGFCERHDCCDSCDCDCCDCCNCGCDSCNDFGCDSCDCDGCDCGCDC